MASPTTPLTIASHLALPCGCGIHIEDQADASTPALSFVYCSHHAAHDAIYEAARNLVRTLSPQPDGSYTITRDAHRLLVEALLDAVDGNRARIYAPEANER